MKKNLSLLFVLLIALMVILSACGGGGDETTDSAAKAGLFPNSESGEYSLPPLPYEYNALEPHIDEQTMRLHHDIHHNGYVKGLNGALKSLAKARKENGVRRNHPHPPGRNTGHGNGEGFDSVSRAGQGYACY